MEKLMKEIKDAAAVHALALEHQKTCTIERDEIGLKLAKADIELRKKENILYNLERQLMKFIKDGNK